MFIAYDFETMVQMRKVLDDNATNIHKCKITACNKQSRSGNDQIITKKTQRLNWMQIVNKISLSDIKGI